MYISCILSYILSYFPHTHTHTYICRNHKRDVEIISFLGTATFEGPVREPFSPPTLSLYRRRTHTYIHTYIRTRADSWGRACESLSADTCRLTRDTYVATYLRKVGWKALLRSFHHTSQRVSCFMSARRIRLATLQQKNDFSRSLYLVSFSPKSLVSRRGFLSRDKSKNAETFVLRR